MSEQQELPREGGSYIRQPDGTLKRADEVAAAAPAEKSVTRSATKKAKE